MIDLINKKRVAIVGPARYMQGSKLGREIDDHDTVVRINRSIETTKTYGEDVGRRTDLLYSCLIEKPANAGSLDATELREYGVKLICAPPKSEMSGVSHATVLHDLVDLNSVRAIAAKIPIRIVDHQFHTRLATLVSCRPNTGFLAIYDLLRFDPAVLSVYGFSFYLDGFIEGCKEGIEEELGMTEEQFTNKCFRSKRHNQQNMWQYAKKTLLNNPIVKLDKTLEAILSMEEFSREKFNELDL